MLNDDIIEAMAEKVVREHGSTTLPICPKSIAEKKDIIVAPKPDGIKGASGYLLRDGENFYILYSTEIDSEGYQRFSIAHELGHYVLEGHVEAILANGEMHTSYANSKNNNYYELEADKFASALLMPKSIFCKKMDEYEKGLPAILKLAKLFNTSATAAARRYISLSEDKIIGIFSTNHKIDYFEISDGFKKLNCQWPRKGTPIPDTLTKSIFVDPNTEPEPTEDYETDETTLGDWLDGDFEHILIEQAKPLGKPGQILTILISPDNDDEIEDTYSKFSQYY